MEYPRGVCPARWLSDLNFPMCVPPHDFLYPFEDMQSNYYRPWKWYNQSICKEFGSTIENEKGNCKITLDVQHFRPNEINVKVADFEIIVEARHEERADTHGFVTRQFKRRYPLPNNCPSENVTSTLSSDGVLTIIAERISPMTQKEKIVPIKICGTSRKTLFESKIPSEITQKENVNTEYTSNELISRKAFKEDNSRLLKPEMMKETISETNGTCSKEIIKERIDIMKTSEKIDPLSISSTSNKIEESIGKTILGLTALTEQLGATNMTGMKSATEMSETKMASEMTGTKSATEMAGTKTASEMAGTKSATEVAGTKIATEMSGAKSALEMSGMKRATELADTKIASEMQSALELIGMTRVSENSNGTKSTSEIPEMSGNKSTSEIFGMKSAPEASDKKRKDILCDVGTLSKTLMEESASSFKSSSSTSTTTRVSANTAECISDIKRELMEAAENV